MKTLNFKIKPASLLLASALSLLSFCNTYAQGSWVELGSGANRLVSLLELTCYADASGNLYAGALDVNLKGAVYNWNGTAWNELGSGSTALNSLSSGISADAIFTITKDPSGNVYTAGSFIDANHREYVAKWNGSAWSELGNGFNSNGDSTNSYIWTVINDASGNIYTAGGFTDTAGYTYVAKWNGSTWSELGTGTNALKGNNNIFCLTIDASGNVFAAGGFTDTNGYSYVAKWNGTTWTEVGTGTNALKANSLIRGMAPDASGNIYVGGWFTNASGKYYVAKWDGTSWTELGGTNALNANNEIYALMMDGSGNVYTGGAFTNANGKHYVAKWDGSAWTELGTGAGSLNANGDIGALAQGASGVVYACGSFADSPASPYPPLNYVAKFVPGLSVTNINKGDNVHIFPNPASNTLSIGLEKQYANANVRITDMTGRELYSSFIYNGKLAIDISSWTNGLYICNVDMIDEKSSFKIVINH